MLHAFIFILCPLSLVSYVKIILNLYKEQKCNGLLSVHENIICLGVSTLISGMYYSIKIWFSLIFFGKIELYVHFISIDSHRKYMQILRIQFYVYLYVVLSSFMWLCSELAILAACMLGCPIAILLISGSEKPYCK